MGIRISKNGHSIRMTGGHARSYMAQLMVENDGEKALEKIADGPLKDEIKRLLEERKKGQTDGPGVVT